MCKHRDNDETLSSRIKCVLHETQLKNIFICDERQEKNYCQKELKFKKTFESFTSQTTFF
jgi:hypothetical protein